MIVVDAQFLSIRGSASDVVPPAILSAALQIAQWADASIAASELGEVVVQRLKNDDGTWGPVQIGARRRTDIAVTDPELVTKLEGAEFQQVVNRS